MSARAITPRSSPSSTESKSARFAVVCAILFRPDMSVIVQKYGGSSVADVDRLRRVAERVMRTRRLGYDVVVVVSAMGDTTDDLLALAKRVSPNPDRRELDMLLTAGERIAMALLSMAIRELGGDAISFTGSQSGIITNDRHVDARIIEVRPVPGAGRARARPDCRDCRLPGHVVPPRGHDARTRRQRHDGGGDGGGARRRGPARSVRTSTASTRPIPRIVSVGPPDWRAVVRGNPGAGRVRRQGAERAGRGIRQGARHRHLRPCHGRAAARRGPVRRRNGRPQVSATGARRGRRRRQRTGRSGPVRRRSTRRSSRCSTTSALPANSCRSPTVG